MQVALQEWSAVVQALADGRTIAVPRTGGIDETGGARFACPHRRFALLPSYLHQQRQRLLPDLAALVEPDPDPQQLQLRYWAELSDCWRLRSVEGLAQSPECLWPLAELQQRFGYRQRHCLTLLVLRVHRFATPVLLPRGPEHAGCRSWIPLPEPLPPALVADTGAPVLTDADFAARRARLAGLPDKEAL